MRDITVGSWIGERLQPFGRHTVGSVVPAGFEAYLRLLHPAYRDDEPVSWRRIAKSNSRTIHPRVQFGNIAGSWESSRHPWLWTRPPRSGTLPLDFVEALVGILRPYTGTPDRCWFAVWAGYRSERGGAVPALATSRLREYHIASGRLDDAMRGVDGAALGARSYRSASMWWPDDRAWFVSTDVDLQYTYLGGTKECVASVAAHTGIESVYASPTDRVTWDSDDVNPTPGPPH